MTGNNLQQKLHNKRIFITEDNALNRVVYTMILNLSGAIIEFDRFGRDTLWRLKGFKPDLIILDLMLPQNNSGFAIFNEIREVPDYKHVPIVAISASDPSFALPKCKNLGFSGFIAKPIEEDLLVNQIVRLIEGEEVWFLGERYGGEAEEDKNT